jgi:hypothetical protein
MLKSIWRGQADDDNTLMCPADGRLTLRLAKLTGNFHFYIEGPLTRAVPKTHVEGIDYLDQHIADDITWTIVGSDIIEGKQAFLDAVKQRTGSHET